MAFEVPSADELKRIARANHIELTAEELAALPMVQETNLHLEPGSHVPGGFGTLSLAGHIAFASSATVAHFRVCESTAI